VAEVAGHEAFHADAPIDQREEIAHPFAIAVVGRDHAADGDAAAHVHSREGRVQVRAADILEIDIDAVGRDFGQARPDLLAPIV
jgi:hypothetical protein